MTEPKRKTYKRNKTLRLLFFRHGDPDYENDTLTPKGHREAALLSDIIRGFSIDEVYVSPLGRAQATAAYSCKVLEKSPVIFEWLKEFPAEVDPNISEDVRRAYSNELIRDNETEKYKTRIMWDILPSYYNDHPELYDRSAWRESPIIKASNMIELYDYVVGEFESFLKAHGYERSGMAYKVKESNDKTIALFCHFGITSVLLSYLWNVSPFVLWQFSAFAPTSVTEVVTEEREKGIAAFRTLRTGDISHLVKGNEEPSFSARFCEIYENFDERH